MGIQTFNNDELGIAVMIEPLSGGYAGYKLTHASFDADMPEEGNQIIEVREYPAGKQSEAIRYAKECVADKVPAGTYLRLI